MPPLKSEVRLTCCLRIEIWGRTDCMDTRFCLLTEISLPLGPICLDCLHGGTWIWVYFLVTMPRVRVLQYSIRQSTERCAPTSALCIGQMGGRPLSVKHRRINFSCTTLYSSWPVGKEFNHARDFCDLFLSRFCQWPASICSNRSDIFKSSFTLIVEQAETTIASMQGIILCPSLLSNSKSSNSPG